MAATIPWAPAPTVSLMDGGRRIKTLQEKGRCQVWVTFERLLTFHNYQFF
jgi:hypothetical protein